MEKLMRLTETIVELELEAQKIDNLIEILKEAEIALQIELKKQTN